MKEIISLHFFRIWSLSMRIIYYFTLNSNILSVLSKGINPKQTKEQQMINAGEKWC